jgi:urease accessory protein
MSLRSPRVWLAVLVAGVAGPFLAAAPAAAHVGHPVEGWVDGLLHPITGPDHLLAMLAVGVVAATMRRSIWLAPAAFLGGMVVGGVAGLIDVPFPGAEVLILGSVFLLGLSIAGALREEGAWAVAALLVAGAAHGHAHGAEAPEAANVAAYLGGFLFATASLHLTGMGLGTIVRDRRTARLSVGLATVTGGALLLA